ncbi:ABC transporter, putative, partial [Ixodes scapularis]
KTYWKTAMTGGLIKVIGDVVGLVGPLSISLILEFVEEKTAKDGEILSNGYIISVVILVATFMQSTCSNNFNHMAIMESVHVRSALQSLVYRKSLRIASDIDIGLAVNHMSVDSFNVMLLFSMGHYIWAVPFKLILLLILLYKQLGYSALVGAATIYVLSPLQYWVCTKLSKLQKEALTISDKRIKHTSELLQGIKLLKLHGWEKVYANMVKEIRAEELKLLRKDAILVAINTFITQGSAILLTLVTFSVYSAIEGRPLTPAKVFSGLALFNQLTVPLYIIPFVIPILNIRDSLLLDKWATCADDSEVFLSDSYSPIDSPAVINMNHAYFTYDMNTKIPILQDMNFTVPTGKLTIIVGPVGSGKTTLLSGMLGELTPYQGTVHIHCIAYVPQRPWLLNSTLKENVLFGQRYDGRRYHQVIQACALQPDIDLLPAKEMTEIGERGINLSGGQRQRIALARAMYSSAKTIILLQKMPAGKAHLQVKANHNLCCVVPKTNHEPQVCIKKGASSLSLPCQVIILEAGKIRCQGNLSEIERMEPDLTSVLSRSVKRQPASFEDNTTQERHKLMRMITKQTLYLPPSTGFRFAGSGSSAESVRSAPTFGGGSWLRSPPSRLSSRISNPADLFIEEEEEEEGKEKEGRADQGKIPCAVYLSYMRACRFAFAALVCVLFAANQGARLGSDFWLTSWSEASRDFNSTLSAQEDDIAWGYLMGYTGLSMFSIVLSLVTNLSAQLVTLRSVKVFHNNMLDTIVQCPMRFFDANPIGRILNRFSSDMGIIDKKLPVTVPVLLRFLMLCITAVLVDVFVTPYFLIVVVFVAAAYYYIQSFFRCSSRELQRLDSITKSPIFSHFSETLAGLSTIRAFREENRFVERMNEHINNNNLAFIMVNCANCWLGISLDYLGGVILFLATMAALTAALTGSISPSFVGIAMTYTLLVPIYLNWLVRQVSSVEMYMSSVERVTKYAQLPIEHVASPAHVPSDWPSKGEVRFEKVTMRYETGLDPVLKNISVTFAPGEKVGICGRTGSGKSSLVMGLFKMVPISEGTIYVDGIDISAVPFDILRSRLSIIPQEPVLFSGTIRQNLDPRAMYTDEQLWSVLEKARLKEVVIVSGGLGISDFRSPPKILSFGSHQYWSFGHLFCFARFLLQPSKVFVLDEATSSLDADLDSLIQETMLSEWADSTILAIAHRVTGLLNFDRVIVLEAGHIVETGAPSELRNRRGSTFVSLLKEAEH